jgi:MlaD protein
VTQKRTACRMAERQSTGTTFLIVLAGFCLAWVGAPCAAASPPVQLAQGTGDLLQLGKEALGLTETTPEDSEQTGITNGVPFLIRFRETVGSLEAGAPVLVRGMQMGAVREVTITYDAATASFNIPVVIELDPAPFTAGEPTGEAAKRVYGVIDAMVRNDLRAEIVGANLLMGFARRGARGPTGIASSGASAGARRAARDPDRQFTFSAAVRAS